MTKFKSLLYREFRLCKKSYILKTVLMLGFSGIVLVMLIAIRNAGLYPDLVSAAVSMGCATIILFSPLLFVQDECLNPDLASGWLRYSYALPISPAERNRVRTARLAITAIISTLYGILCALLICAVFGVKFKAGYIVIAAAVNDYGLFFRFMDDVFILRARTPDDAKKYKIYSAIAEAVVLSILVLIIIKAFDIDFIECFRANYDAEEGSDIPFRLPESDYGDIGAIHLLWSAPLMFVLFAADYFVGCLNLQKASSPGKLFKSGAKAEKEVDLTAPHIDISGFLYKEFTQNRKGIYTVLAAPFLMSGVVALILFVVSFNQDFVGIDISAIDNWFAKAFTSEYCRACCMALGYFLSGTYMLYIFSNDDKKLWAYFIASTSDGIRKFVSTKYVVYFAMNGLFFISCYVMDCTLSTLRWFTVGEEAVPTISIAVLLFFFSIFIESFRIPLIIRYGNKKGEIIMATALIILGILAAVVLLLLPVDVLYAAMDWVADLISGKDISDIATFIISAVPFAAMGVYLLSCRISGKLFLKGANEYVK